MNTERAKHFVVPSLSPSAPVYARFVTDAQLDALAPGGPPLEARGLLRVAYERLEAWRSKRPAARAQFRVEKAPGVGARLRIWRVR